MSDTRNRSGIGPGSRVRDWKGSGVVEQIFGRGAYAMVLFDEGNRIWVSTDSLKSERTRLRRTE